MENSTAKYLMYKDKPLIRFGNFIYYGKPDEEYVIVMQIMSTKQSGDLKVADKISVQLHRTDPAVKATERIVKRADKTGLYNAMDIADIWLERANSPEN